MCQTGENQSPVVRRGLSFVWRVFYLESQVAPVSGDASGAPCGILVEQVGELARFLGSRVALEIRREELVDFRELGRAAHEVFDLPELARI